MLDIFCEIRMPCAHERHAKRPSNQLPAQPHRPRRGNVYHIGLELSGSGEKFPISRQGHIKIFVSRKAHPRSWRHDFNAKMNWKIHRTRLSRTGKNAKVLASCAGPACNGLHESGNAVHIVDGISKEQAAHGFSVWRSKSDTHRPAGLRMQLRGWRRPWRSPRTQRKSPVIWAKKAESCR